MNKKFLAFYLPQFHTITENDLWWGQGFTEWERVKRAKPLFDGHHQPRIPYEYYNLEDTDVMVKQAELAREYGVYGFCYYHYWFKGKKLLQKPLENMLNHPEVNIPFCLSWANEPWTRAWAGKSKEILMAQEYGGENDWNSHINYLIPFFSDKRYIKIDGKPVFLIYRTESFPEFDKMISYWNDKLKEKNFSPLYIIEMLTSYQKKPICKLSEGVLEFEPMFTIGKSNSLRAAVYYYLRKKIAPLLTKPYSLFKYENVWGKILKRKINNYNKDLYLGAFVDWDNTPRFRDKSTIFINSSPEKFSLYLNKQTERSSTEFIFINAWNEWAEGAYLEPDKKNKTGYLQAIRTVITNSQSGS